MNSTEIIDKKFLPSLSRIFTPIVIDKLTQNGFSPYLLEICKNSGFIDKIDKSLTLGSFFDMVYNSLFKYYRNAYIYKNVIANKILLGKHSLNTSHMLSEFRVGFNKADVVIINGTSSVYEIKSEYDTLNRLDGQINAYREIFDFINVISSFSQVDKLCSVLPEKIGIMILTERNTISTVREASSNKVNFNPSKLFGSLRKDEYTSIIKKYYGELPNVPNTMIFDVCKGLFCQIPVEMAHDLAFEQLKKRTNVDILKKFTAKAPLSMVAYGTTISTQEKKVHKLLSMLDQSFESLLTPNLN
jgi:hypothetical protein